MVGTVDRVPQAVAGNLVALTADGNIQDSGKRSADFCPALLAKSFELFVDAVPGSDSNNGLSAAHPKKTISSVINAIPRLLTDGRVLINITPGEYREDLTIQGFIGVGPCKNPSIFLPPGLRMRPSSLEAYRFIVRPPFG